MLPREAFEISSSFSFNKLISYYNGPNDSFNIENFHLPSNVNSLYILYMSGSSNDFTIFPYFNMKGLVLVLRLQFYGISFAVSCCMNVILL